MNDGQDGRRPAETGSFLFADLAGYTALTEVHGDDHAADLALEFFDHVRGLIARRGCALVKTLGDAVMIRADRPLDAVQVGLEIDRGIGRHHGWPPVRVGIHTGRAVERRGDWFGAAVNVAARVLNAAEPGQVVVTDDTRAAIESSRLEFRPLGRHELRNVLEGHDLYQALAAGEEPTEPLVDPVCRMSVDPERSDRSVAYGGAAYRFCSDPCADAFVAAPDRYATRT
jgi:adenylate cyclase